MKIDAMKKQGYNTGKGGKVKTCGNCEKYRLHFPDGLGGSAELRGCVCWVSNDGNRAGQ
jgi:hypothetical protein